MPTTPIRIAIVDDHRMLLGAMAEWLRSTTADIALVTTAASWPELLAHPAFPVDVVLLDVDLKDGIPVTLKLNALSSLGVKSVLMSTYSDPAIVREGLAAGASGYVVKSEPIELIVAAIRAANHSQRYLSAELSHLLDSDRTVRPKLSAQERRVMGLYCQGKTVNEVAADLSISVETAKSYLKRVREKYRAAGHDVRTKVALRKRALADGILIEADR